MGSARSFATATTMCWPCHKKQQMKQQMVKCDACGRQKESDKFDGHIFSHHVKHGRRAVCMHCVECGYSPADVKSYQCQGRGGHACGHKAFDRTALENAKRRQMQDLMCKECGKDTLHCLGCKAYLPRSSFKESMWHNGRHHGQQSVCTRCEAVGLSPRSVQLYMCDQCSQTYGHMKFNKTALENSKRQGRTTKLCCEKCRNESMSSSAEAHVRQRTLLSTLRQKDAWKCTCKGRIAHKHKAYHALNQRSHTERCELHPASMGEKRWDGKNKGITLDDLRFLLDRNAY